MDIFKRIKIQATVETSAMLLPDNRIEAALGELQNKLKELNLDVVSLTSAELPTVAPVDSADDDPWSVGGRAAH